MLAGIPRGTVLPCGSRREGLLAHFRPVVRNSEENSFRAARYAVGSIDTMATKPRPVSSGAGAAGSLLPTTAS